MEFQQAFVIRFRVQGLVWASLAVIKSGFKKGFRMPGRERARERERGGRALVPGGPYSRETQTERGFVLLLKELLLLLSRCTRGPCRKPKTHPAFRAVRCEPSAKGCNRRQWGARASLASCEGLGFRTSSKKGFRVSLACLGST